MIAPGRAPRARACYHRAMKSAVALALVLAACAGNTKPVHESPIVNEGSDTPESCCCKVTPITSDDGKPHYDMTPRMECSAQKGECVPDVQCQRASATPTIE